MTTKVHQRVGRVMHYYPRIHVAIINLATHVERGDMLHFEGRKTDFVQELNSMQIDHEDVVEADKGDLVGIQVSREVRDGDEVHRETTIE